MIKLTVPPRRSAFTLVEMMVAMTLTIFVMVILSQCFVEALETFSGLKAVGDMQGELRTATILIRADLSTDHFEAKRRLSDPAASLVSEKIREGFFVIGQGYPGRPSNKAKEGTEDLIDSYRATDHWLHFSAKMRGNARERFFTAPVSAPLLGATGLPVATSYVHPSADAVFQDSGNVIHSAWAEIVYLLLPTGTTVNPGAPGPVGTPLFALYRCQYVVLPITAPANAARIGVSPNASPFDNVAGNAILNPGQGPKYVMNFLSPNDLANGYLTRTFNPYDYFLIAPVDNKKPPRGAALVLSNVISFQVQVMQNMTPPSSGDFTDLGLFGINTTTKKPFPIPFDSANYLNGPILHPMSGVSLIPTVPPYTISGLQITIRIWDPKSRLTRQVTLLQDM